MRDKAFGFACFSSVAMYELGLDPFQSYLKGTKLELLFQLLFGGLTVFL